MTELLVCTPYVGFIHILLSKLMLIQLKLLTNNNINALNFAENAAYQFI